MSPNSGMKSNTNNIVWGALFKSLHNSIFSLGFPHNKICMSCICREGGWGDIYWSREPNKIQSHKCNKWRPNLFHEYQSLNTAANFVSILLRLNAIYPVSKKQKLFSLWKRALFKSKALEGPKNFCYAREWWNPSDRPFPPCSLIWMTTPQ